MSWLSKALKKGAKYTPGYQAQKALGISNSNTLWQVGNPGGAAINNIASGKPITGKSLLNPGSWGGKPYMPDPEPIPGTPLIDDAAADRAQGDRSRRRRGVLATVFGGGAKKTTLG